MSRGRVHVLFHGPPGTAKTELLLAGAKVAGCEVYSPRMTGPGLTVDLRTGEPGVLPRQHATEFGLVVADEVEKVPSQVVRQTLQALEEGEFTYSSANGEGSLKAEVRFIGAANEIEGLPPEFRDRMDFLVHVPLPTREQGRNIVDAITKSFMRPGAERQNDYLRDYLRWVRGHVPAFQEPERELASRLLQMLVDLHTDDNIRVRPFISILRVAYAMARLSRADVTGETILEAIRLLHPELGPGRFAALRSLAEATRHRRVT